MITKQFVDELAEKLRAIEIHGKPAFSVVHRESVDSEEWIDLTIGDADDPNRYEDTLYIPVMNIVEGTLLQG